MSTVLSSMAGAAAALHFQVSLSVEQGLSEPATRSAGLCLPSGWKRIGSSSGSLRAASRTEGGGISHFKSMQTFYAYQSRIIV